MDKVTIQTARPSDIGSIIGILNEDIRTSAYTLDTSQWTYGQGLFWFMRHNSRYTILVARCNDAVVGYAALAPFRLGEGFSPTAENSVYVRRDMQRRGIGKKLLTAIVDHARGQGFALVVATITRGNEASRALHEACGFQEVGVFPKAAKRGDKPLDIIMMEQPLIR